MYMYMYVFTLQFFRKALYGMCKIPAGFRIVTELWLLYLIRKINLRDTVPHATYVSLLIWAINS